MTYGSQRQDDGCVGNSNESHTLQYGRAAAAAAASAAAAAALLHDAL